MSDLETESSEDENVPMTGNNGVILCLTRCGFNTPAQRNGWIAEGMNVMLDICTFRPEEIYDIGANIQRMTAVRGGSRQGRAQLRKLEALVRWCLERKSVGRTLDAREFTIDTMMDTVERIRLEKDAKDVDDDTLTGPGKFKPNKWVSWKLSLNNYLAQLSSLMDKLPLSYVIRGQAPDLENADPETLRFWSVRLQGKRFQKDNTKVWNILKSLVIDTDGWTWIEEYDDPRNDGRAAMKALISHYDGPGEKEKRIAEARATLQNVHYRSEKHAVNWEVYVTKLKEAFTTLSDNGHKKEEDEKVDIMLDHIDQYAPLSVQTAITNVRMNPVLKHDFIAAANSISELIVKATSTGPGSITQPRGRRVSFVRGGRGRGQGRGGRHGRGGGRGRGNPALRHATTVDGVDVTDPSRQFSREEYGKLINANYIPILKCRCREAGRNPPSRDASSVLSARIAALEGAMQANNDNNSATHSNPTNNSQTGDGASTISNGTQFGSGAYANTEPARKKTKRS